LLVGMIGSLSVKYLPSQGVLARGFRPSVPFIVMVVFLIFYARYLPPEARERDRHVSRYLKAGIRAEQPRPLVRGLQLVGLAAVVLAVPLVLNDFWVTIVTGGVALSIIFLSYTVVTGEGGMISLCQITFAGIGAIATAQFATQQGWPLGFAVLAGGLIAVPFGLLVALPALRLGDLYLALATLAFALLMDNIVFPIQRFDQIGVGVNLARPAIGSFGFSSDLRYYYLLVAVFAVFALVVANLRHSTTGMGLAAMRASEPATSTLGFSVLRGKLMLFGLSAFIAGVGGSLLATFRMNALPSDYNALIGIVWLAIVVTLGVRSAVGALIAGVLFPVFGQLVGDWFGAHYSLLTPVVFGAGAIILAREPRGLLTFHRERLRSGLDRLRARGRSAVVTQ
jgi:branched-chain amino acid transport system permease protein